MQTHELTIDAGQISAVPHLDQWSGAWLIEPDYLSTLVAAIQGLDLRTHLSMTSAALQAAGRAQKGLLYTEVQEGVAIVSVQGSLMKHRASLSTSSSTVELRREMRALANRDDVDAVMLNIESPGGTAAGTQELADEINRLRQSKPVFAFIEDLGASAAYWVASQGEKVFANAPAKVGSIGTFAVVQDLSAAAAQQGIKVHVVKAGVGKGVGVPGTEVTAEQLGELQRIVNGINEFFLQGVARGRGMSLDQVQELADGRIHLAADAKRLGLIDGVMSFEAALDSIRRPQTRSRKPMSETQTATSKQIKAACPGIDSDTLLTYLEAEKSLDQCKDAWMQELATELEAAREQIETLTAERDEAKAQAEAASKRHGVEAVEETASSQATASATEEFRSLVAAKVATGITKHRAVAAVAKEHKELHSRMLAEANGR